MIAALVLAILQVSGVPETLPIDERMAAYEASMPELANLQTQLEAEIGRVGPVEAGWATSGLSTASAIAAGRGNATEHVLGEWSEGNPGVVTAGDYPLSMPRELRRYVVRAYQGPVDFHVYHRLSSGIVLHGFGAVNKIGNSDCQQGSGIELISRQPWQDWSPEGAFIAFSMAHSNRGDPRTYCVIFRRVDEGRFRQLAYTPDGRPYSAVNDNPQAFVVTPRAEATARIFETATTPSTSD